MENNGAKRKIIEQNLQANCIHRIKFKKILCKNVHFIFWAFTSWLTRHSLPCKVIVERENKFLAKFREMIVNDYGIMVRPITSRNPQVNAILERVHRMISNILCIFKVQKMVLDDKIHGMT